MLRTDFNYDLPESLIAQHPPEYRTSSRLLFLDSHTGNIQDCQFTAFPKFISPGDLLIFNDTKVIPARLFGHKPTGGKVEILVERVLNEHSIIAQVRASKSPKPHTPIYVDGDVKVTVTRRVDSFFELFFDDPRSVYDILQTVGHTPLPPYIQRSDDCQDTERYQTVYARHPGAVAAPTAGLHFDEAMLNQLTDAGVHTAFVTLHVGAGTFSPMRVNDLSQHVMHSEYVQVSTEVCQAVQAARERKGKVIAIGTTAVRALETASQEGELKPYQGDTRLFITPGYPFQTVDALLTNFHLPESTLLMLVCAFGGYQQVMNAYHHAVEQCYRFFSYGDAMFLHRLRT